MRLMVQFAAAGLFAVVCAFQACSRVGFSEQASTSFPSATSANATTSTDNSGTGNPYDGKIAIYQVRDANCRRLSQSDVKQEIVANSVGYWLTVDQCKKIAAENVTSKVAVDKSVPAQIDTVIYESSILATKEKLDANPGATPLHYCQDNTGSLEVWKASAGYLVSYVNASNSGSGLVAKGSASGSGEIPGYSAWDYGYIVPVSAANPNGEIRIVIGVENQSYSKWAQYKGTTTSFIWAANGNCVTQK